MSGAEAYADKRQFGRRPSNIRGYVMLPGQTHAECTLINISDGGALIDVRGVDELPPSLRLVVVDDDKTFNLVCEVRHWGTYGVGVRFVRQSEGAALNRRFLMKPMTAVDKAPAAPPPLKPAPARPHCNRALRGEIKSKIDTVPADTPETSGRLVLDWARILSNRDPAT